MFTFTCSSRTAQKKSLKFCAFVFLSKDVAAAVGGLKCFYLEGPACDQRVEGGRSGTHPSGTYHLMLHVLVALLLYDTLNLVLKLTF